MMMKLNAKQLRVTRPTPEQMKDIVRNPVYIVLDNVMDTYNIGAIFRLADATAVTEMILCAGSETPPSSRIHKAAVGTEEWVPWRYFPTAAEAILQLRKDVPGIQVLSIEQDDRSVDWLDVKVAPGTPVAVVVGHETEGVSKEAMEMSDMIVELPMWGVNKSLNVMVTTGVMLYKILEGYNKK